MKTYVITLSEKFPTTHPRKGQETEFGRSFLNGKKIHTIRGELPSVGKTSERSSGGTSRSICQTMDGHPVQKSTERTPTADKRGWNWRSESRVRKESMGGERREITFLFLGKCRWTERGNQPRIYSIE